MACRGADYHQPVTEAEVRSSLNSPSKAPSRSRARALIRAVRPRQWPKNALVFSAPAAAGALREPSIALKAAAATGLFVLISAATYLVNDVIDAPQDRLHPKKRNRPIASGEVAAPLAIGLAIGGLALGLALSALVTLPLLAILVAYVALSLSYSLGLKRVPVVEMAVLAAGFVLRATAGGAACHIAISPWFLIVTSGGAMFIVAGKRDAEISILGDDAAGHRAVLERYPAAFLFATRLIAACVTVTAYCLWVFERSGHLNVRSNFHNLAWFELSIVPFVLAVLMVELAIETGGGGEPEEIALRNRGVLLAGVAWVGLVAAGIYA